MAGVDRERQGDDAAKCDAILVTKSKIPGKQGTVRAFCEKINGEVLVTNQDGASYGQDGRARL